MKDKNQTLKIFNFSHPLMQTEIFSLTGDKYKDTLPFKWEITSDYAASDVVLWDGVITVKNKEAVEKVIDDVKSGKVLFLLGESETLLKNHLMVKLQNTENLNCVARFGWNVLPEEILSALEICYKKSKHV